jgi:RTX calcium-binding nonapeptide repeat (4 copies)
VPPDGGVITSWSYAAPASADEINFKVIRPAGGGDFLVVADTPVQTMTPGTVNTFPIRVPVQGGDSIAIHNMNSGAGCVHFMPAQPGDRVDGCTACDPPQGTTYTAAALQAGIRVNVAAQVEPDADKDGFGDESQDQCTTDPSAQGACPTPTISGTAQAGSQLTGNPNGQPNNPSFQWLRCDGAGGSCSAIPGATSTTYTPTGADVGFALRFRKTATNSSGSQTTDSAPTSQVAPNANRCSTPFTGTVGDDTIAGTSGGDDIFGLAGNDTLSGLAGRDCLDGASGNDRLSGGSEGDRLSAGSGRDRLSGGSGRDRLSGGPGRDRSRAGSGNDRLSGESGNDRLSGQAGNDRISGGGGRDRLSGGGGRNRVSGGSGNDVLNVVNGRRDTANCGPGRDTVRADGRDGVRGCERVIRP